MRFIKSLSVLLFLALSFVGFTAQAADFVEKKIVLQVSDKQSHKKVLNVAANLLKHYGKDQVKVEIVAFGPGLGVLIAGKKNKNLDRITSLAGSGVKFNACGNTIRKVTKKRKGKAPKLHAAATVVPAGVVRIIELQDKGYTLIRP
jgi:intracellular sulfur oxidation DsrE/DsrF family protein